MFIQWGLVKILYKTNNRICLKFCCKQQWEHVKIVMENAVQTMRTCKNAV